MTKIRDTSHLVAWLGLQCDRAMPMSSSAFALVVTRMVATPSSPRRQARGRIFFFDLMSASGGIDCCWPFADVDLT